MKVVDMAEINGLKSRDIPKMFAICNQSDMAPVWGYIVGPQGMSSIPELLI